MQKAKPPAWMLVASPRSKVCDDVHVLVRSDALVVVLRAEFGKSVELV